MRLQQTLHRVMPQYYKRGRWFKLRDLVFSTIANCVIPTELKHNYTYTYWSALNQAQAVERFAMDQALRQVDRLTDEAS